MNHQLIHRKRKGDNMSLLPKLAAALTAVGAFVVFASPALAAVGQIEQGDIYWAKDVTQNGSFVDPTSANAGDTLLYRVRIHNPGEACLTNVRLKAILPSTTGTTNKSTITVWADTATTNYVTDTATVNLSSSQTINYVPGTTQLLNNSGVIQTLPDTIFTSGVNIGGVCVSTNNERFVQFEATVSKPAPPTVTYTATATASATATATAKATCPAGQNGSAEASATATASASATATSTVSQQDAQSKAQAAAQAQANANAQAQAQAQANAKAKAEVKCTTPTVTTTSTPPPAKATVLPNTGAGDVLGIFTGASAFGGVGHYIVSRRKRGL